MRNLLPEKNCMTIHHYVASSGPVTRLIACNKLRKISLNLAGRKGLTGSVHLTVLSVGLFTFFLVLKSLRIL